MGMYGCALSKPPCYAVLALYLAVLCTAVAQVAFYAVIFLEAR